jgi:hypothetical protein
VIETFQPYATALSNCLVIGGLLLAIFMRGQLLLSSLLVPTMRCRLLSAMPEPSPATLPCQVCPCPYAVPSPAVTAHHSLELCPEPLLATTVEALFRAHLPFSCRG